MLRETQGEGGVGEDFILGELAFPGDERIYGEGECQLDGDPPPEYGNSPELTGVASRAKQFVPFAALRGFYKIIEEVSAARNAAGR